MKYIIATGIVLIGMLVYTTPPNLEAQNRAGVHEGVNCYCDYNTGWCEGLKVSNNQASC